MSDEHFLSITRYYDHSLAERIQTAETALLRGRAPALVGPEDEAPNWRCLTCFLNIVACFCVLVCAAGVERSIFIMVPFVFMLNTQYFILNKRHYPSLLLAGICGIVGSFLVSLALRKPGFAEPTRATVVCVGLTLLYRTLDWVSREGRYLINAEKLD